MEKYLDMCQRPKRAFLISTFNNGYNRTNRLLCVNALNGLFLFLPLSIFLVGLQVISVSTP